jgi:predicted  nucleic acid-binding Zn-ribbon protein
MCPDGYYEAEKGETGRVELMSNFKSVVERIRTLETERKNLLLEIEELKKMANSKAGALESEVSMLKEEMKSLRVLLGADEQPEVDLGQKRKQAHK